MISNNDKISANIKNAAIKYSENLPFRPLISSIPYIGSTLDLILSLKGQEFIRKRIENTISCLTDEFGNLEKNKIVQSSLIARNFSIYL